MWRKRTIIEWSLLLLAATVWSFAHLALGLSDHNKMVLWPGYEGHARCNLHKKNVWWVGLVVKRRGCCCNLSAGITLNVRFTTNEMCAKNNTHLYVVWTSNNRVISLGDVYCCLLPQCEALHTCCWGVPIATVTKMMLVITYLFLFQQSFPNYLRIIFYLAFHHLLPPQTISLVLSENMVLICIYFYSSRLPYDLNKSTYSVCNFFRCS